MPADRPFPDVLKSETAPDRDVEFAPHPSLKPQRFLRRIVWGALPLGWGTIVDPFMGSGSTLAAAESMDYDSIGLEIDADFTVLAAQAILHIQTKLIDPHSHEV